MLSDIAAAFATAPRARCVRCRRPEIVCYCAALPRLDTETRVVILQHPRERDMPIGTARMASLCLPRAELHVGIRWSASAPLAAALADPARPPILLYPGPGARDILRDPPAGPVTLVVVDGTWSQAKVVVRDNPILQALPRYAFAAPELSQYRIRKEPRAEYCSTIEALMHVLGVLERDPPRFRAMLEPLHAMVDAQLAAQARSPRRETLRQPKASEPPRRRLPDALHDRAADLVVLVGEANAWPHRTGGAHPPDELVHIAARRLATGEQLDVIAAPIGELAPSATYHTGLTEAQLRAGVSRAALHRAMVDFLRPTDVVCAWGLFGAALAQAEGIALPDPFVDLRAAAQQLLHAKVGTLEAFAATFGEVPAPLTAGRAGVRLAMLARIVETWRAQYAG